MSIAIIYGGNNGTTRGLNSFFGKKGNTIEHNGIEVIRINTDTQKQTITNSEISEIELMIVVGGNPENLPDSIKLKSKEVPIKYYEFRDILKSSLNKTYNSNDYFSNTVRKTKRAFRRGMIASLIELNTSDIEKSFVKRG